MIPLPLRLWATLAWPMAVLGGQFHVQFEQPTLDRWMYPFNASPGGRPAAPVFSTFGDESGVDTRHGQFLMGWDTAPWLPTNHPPSRYIITLARLTLRTLREGSFLNDSTADSFASYLPANSPLSVPDGDPGRPVELFGAGFRNGFSEEAFVESAPFGSASTAGRNAFAAGFDPEGKLVDVSNNVGKTNAAWSPFPSSPFAVGVIANVPAGDPVPAGSPVTFDLNLKDPWVLRYLQSSLSLGRLRLTASWLGESDGISGTPRYPDFATRGNPPMYWYDSATRETVFERAGERRSPTTLVCSLGAQRNSIEVPMNWVGGRWRIRVKLPNGFHCYGFRAGTQVVPDRDAGAVRTAQGERRSLVVVPRFSRLR